MFFAADRSRLTGLYAFGFASGVSTACSFRILDTFFTGSFPSTILFTAPVRVPWCTALVLYSDIKYTGIRLAREDEDKNLHDEQEAFHASFCDGSVTNLQE